MRGVMQSVLRGVVGVVLLAATARWVEAAGVPGVDPKELYTVVYQVNDTESRTLDDVEVLEVIKIGSRAFLLVELRGFGDKKAYLDLDSVRSIIQR